MGTEPATLVCYKIHLINAILVHHDLRFSDLRLISVTKSFGLK